MPEYDPEIPVLFRSRHLQREAGLPISLFPEAAVSSLCGRFKQLPRCFDFSFRRPARRCSLSRRDLNEVSTSCVHVLPQMRLFSFIKKYHSVVTRLRK